ncbi:MAG: DUF4430 domain-containing protein [Bacteriovoracaceae bacterium]
MKKIILILSFITLNAYSVTFEIIGGCSKTPLFSINTSAKFETVGDLTIHLLNKNRIPYQGNERAINSIFNTILGIDSLEVVSDTQMRSYGWCFRVNGVVPDRYADEIYLNEEDHIEWFYAYAWYDKGWSSMCNPSYEVKSPWICK